jgi:uncharacterized protein (DUF1684 family)
MAYDLDTTTFAQEWQQWHARHEAVRADKHGFLAITSLNWLTEVPQRFADAPGSWSTGPGGVVVELDDHEELAVDGVRVHGRLAFGIIPERGGINVVAGDAVLEVAKRGGYDILRPRHPENPLRVNYTSTPAYEPDPAWRIDGRYVPFAEPRPVTVGAAVEGVEHVYEAPGQVEFAAGGRTLSLTAFNGYSPGDLFILFTDATSGVTTYAANRSLRIGAPAADGSVVLDFNRATNLPCAYTEFATCPLPPTENRLSIAVEAGERTPV